MLRILRLRYALLDERRDFGLQVPMVLVMDDLAHFADMNSPVRWGAVMIAWLITVVLWITTTSWFALPSACESSEPTRPQPMIRTCTGTDATRLGGGCPEAGGWREPPAPRTGSEETVGDTPDPLGRRRRG